MMTEVSDEMVAEAWLRAVGDKAGMAADVVTIDKADMRAALAAALAVAPKTEVSMSAAAKVILAAVERQDEALYPAWDAAQDAHDNSDPDNAGDCAESFIRALAALEDQS